jgi:hypothetical protein
LNTTKNQPAVKKEQKQKKKSAPAFQKIKISERRQQENENVVEQ